MNTHCDLFWLNPTSCCPKHSLHGFFLFVRFVKLLSLCCWLVFKRFTFSLGTNGLDAKFHRREVGKYWETEQHNDYFGLFKGFVDNKKMTKERQFDPLKLRTYHPFNPEVDEGAESKDDPEERTNNQSEPEDSGLRIWRLLLPSALKKKKRIFSQLGQLQILQGLLTVNKYSLLNSYSTRGRYHVRLKTEQLL